MEAVYLVVEPESPDESIMSYELGQGCHVLGRAHGKVDICLDDNSVAAVHCLLFIEKDGSVFIRDENSAEGVRVDETRIPPNCSVRVQPDSNIYIGVFMLYIVTRLEPGVRLAPASPGIHANLSDADVLAMRKSEHKLFDQGGNAYELKAGSHVFNRFLIADALEERAKSESDDSRYIFPPMPVVHPDRQADVDRFIHRRIKPLFEKLVQERAGSGVARPEETRELAMDVLNNLIGQHASSIPAELSRSDMVTLALAAFMDYGPLQTLLGDESITEIMVNGPSEIFVEKRGKITKSHLRFFGESELRRVIEKMVAITNRRIDEQQPYQNTRLEDGSRVNVIIRPLSLRGDSITIRKFPNRHLLIQDLIDFGAVSERIAAFLKFIVRYKANTLVSGGTGTGKTTLLNVLSGFIPEDERIVSIEDSAELRLVQPNRVCLEAKPKSSEGGGAITIRDLFINALRMRPDRIIVGECRGGEALDMLQAMNTGHEGSLTTLHANSPRDALGRIETMCLMSGVEIPARAVRSQIASGVNFIVQQSRLGDGARKITSIQEVTGMDGDQVVMQEIFKFQRKGIDAKGKFLGKFVPTGVVPAFVQKLREDKFDFPMDLFKA